MKPYASGPKPRTTVRYSGSTAATDSDDTSVSRLTMPSPITVAGIRRRRPAARPLGLAPDDSCSAFGVSRRETYI